MARTKILDEARSRVLISDGAWGTILQEQGMKPGECPELWCVTHPEVVEGIGRAYVEAGADLIETNSFGGTWMKLDAFGCGDRVTEINRAAAGLSRKAAGERGRVIASIGPTGKILITEEELEEEDLYRAFADQAKALHEGGADAVCIETMSAMDEATLAIRAVRENTPLEVICTFTFERTVQGSYRTMMGLSPEAAAEGALAAGAHLIGANCGNGLERMVDIVSGMKGASGGAPILVHANAGLPVMEGGRTRFPETPDDMARRIGAVIEAGARIIGGCCGTTPAHIRAMRQAVSLGGW